MRCYFVTGILLDPTHEEELLGEVTMTQGSSVKEGDRFTTTERFRVWRREWRLSAEKPGLYIVCQPLDREKDEEETEE